MDNSIGLVPINGLKSLNFIIPDYQRGYRWSQQQVKDLLDDIQEFISNENADIYCLQPLVVKNRYDEQVLLSSIKDAASLLEVKELIGQTSKWEVIDGQQRLTTIYILLKYLGEDGFFSIAYATRPGSAEFLKNMGENRKTENIDFFYMCQARNVIADWFETNEGKVDKANFKAILQEQVKFIWYETNENNPIEVFTRLNIGKISLTNAELIKAVVLNSSNFSEGDPYAIRLKQQEIALQWDEIENKLENDEFWLFLHKKEDKYETRLDWIFDLICDNDKLELHLSDKDIGVKGKDEYRTFRYFYHKFHQPRENPHGEQKVINDVWRVIMQVFNSLDEWFNDVILYHYVGYLLAEDSTPDKTITDMLKKWGDEGNRQKLVNSQKDDISRHLKKEFVEYLKGEIKEKLYGLDQHYDGQGEPPKTECKPILLLFNIQSVINENLRLKNASGYHMGVFHKFPFHLYKSEKWEVEHIDSRTTNSLDEEKDRRDFLYASLVDIKDKELAKKIIDYLNMLPKEVDSKIRDEDFHELQGKIEKLETDESNREGLLSEDEKDRIWNFTLLDQNTNRSYKNALFISKRRTIIGKNQGIHSRVIFLDEKTEEKLESLDYDSIKRIPELNYAILTEKGIQAFVPQCTLNVFTKYYSPSTNKLREWTKSDAEDYLRSIKSTLQDFLK